MPDYLKGKDNFKLSEGTIWEPLFYSKKITQIEDLSKDPKPSMIP